MSMWLTNVVKPNNHYFSDTVERYQREGFLSRFSTFREL